MFMKKQIALAIALAVSASAMAATPQYVIAISVDGGGSNYIEPLLSQLPGLNKIFVEGAGTFNARTDAGVAVTLPSHTGMITGRPMNNYTTPLISGHNWTLNSDPAVGQTLHTNKGSYIASAFDVVHDNGKSTAMWSGKSKFSLFDTSYNSTNGALDVTGADNGRDKLDYAYINASVSASTLTTDFLSKMGTTPYNFSFVHYQDPDAAGHAYGWGSATYNNSLIAVDLQIARILTAIENSPTLSGNTVVMLTADHGGTGTGHGDTTSLLDTKIPFLVWGAGVNAGDIYGMNVGVLGDPLTGIPQYTGMQPMRNANLGNLALDMLDLGAIPGSTIGAAQTIAVPEPTGLAFIGVMSIMALRRKRKAA